jgi:hypothetical protein
MRASKVIVAALCVAAVTCAINVKTIDIINKVNNAKTSWTAGVNKFTAWTEQQQKTLVGSAVLPWTPYTEEQMAKIKEFQAKTNSLPENFDSRDQWKGCVGSIRDQARCGS